MYPYIQLSDLADPHRLINQIYLNGLDNHYITDDYSPEIYDALAFAGFISVTIEDHAGRSYLLPEIQFSYAVLHWDNLHLPKRFKKFLSKHIVADNYRISINHNIDAVFNGIKKHHHDNNWMSQPYYTMLKELGKSKQTYQLQLASVELWDEETLIGGEIGYFNGRVYTSLSSFFDKQNYPNFGKVQIVALALLLQQSGYAFWNMGHPYMQYKFDFGALEYSRFDFLKLWITHRSQENTVDMMGQQFSCHELLQTLT